ncbi:PotD/PotF family extracellular solute-binding protein [Pseudooceanicola nanhaiensis]|jgi:putative spermidine/putrescine transport system substrate-binding protein|uniref:ABC transporter substrate-binding protein n=1 Tax=Pseudooceanicola nanhaiensis TaxID=375761 RepID=A0A917SIU5_9RHOB|nr:extracellular solute-binding protein [Pseudooceanicola nanhaiensis]GGL82508.1 ABC transporter substrate-binding protein [Pseudooceanicola nanhaiensis]
MTQTDKTKPKAGGLSRRSVLKSGAAAAAASAFPAPMLWAQNIKDIKIVHVGQSYSTIPNIAEKANEDLDFTVEMQTAPDLTTQVNRMLSQPKSLDVTDVGNTTLKYYVGRGFLQPLNVSEYKYWDKTVPLFTSGTYPSGEKASMQGYAPIKAQYYTGPDAMEYSLEPTEWLVGMPLYYNADTLGIRPDLIGRPIDSWAELLNPEFSGKVALQDGTGVGVPDAAMALEAMGDVSYVDKGNMTREEIDKTIEKLIEYKRDGHFRSFWTNFDQSVQLMASGEVVLQSMWSPAVTEVRTRGVECVYNGMKEGYRGWYIMMMPMAHLEGLKRECAIEYMNWYNSGWAGAFISRQGFYNSVPENVKSHMTENEYGYWYEGKPATEAVLNPFGKVMEEAGVVRDGGALWDRMGNIGIWNTLMDEDRYLVRRWQDFLAA